MDEVLLKSNAEEQERFDKLLAMRGTENAYKLHRELVGNYDSKCNCCS